MNTVREFRFPGMPKTDGIRFGYLRQIATEGNGRVNHCEPFKVRPFNPRILAPTPAPAPKK